jgi:8-amino-3,8-dideoxy-alpha-D-manno-octulosonate transaminase
MPDSDLSTTSSTNKVDSNQGPRDWSLRLDQDLKAYSTLSYYGALMADDEELEAVTRVIKSKKWSRDHSGDSGECAQFEREAAKAMGVKYCNIVNSGTSALICALRGVGVEPGDEVLVPTFTWIATASCVMAIGAKPVAVDVEETTLGLDVTKAEHLLTDMTKAMLVVHMNGVSMDIEAAVSFCNRHNLQLVEDCCQAAGVKFNGKMLGSFGHASAWSLNSNKIITCGEGGVMFTDDEFIYKRSKMSVKQNIYFPQVPRIATYQKYSISEICAAVARVQLTKMDDIIARLTGIKNNCMKAFTNTPQTIAIPQKILASDADAGATVALIFTDKHCAQKAKAYLDNQNADFHYEVMFHPDVVDLHISYWWDTIPDQQQGRNTAELLSRTMICRFNCDMDAEYGTHIGEWLLKAVLHCQEASSA